MRGPSRASLAAAREQLMAALADHSGAAALGDELFAVAHERLESLGYVAPGGDFHHDGLDIPEFYGPDYIVDEGFEHLPKGRRPYRIEPGMALALQVHVKDHEGRGVEGGMSYVITEDGYRALGDIPPVQILQTSA